MQDADVIVVGGGPAGSACATVLARAGRRVIVLDREPFPRTKLCAGWVTPAVFQALGMEPASYPGGLHTFDRLVIHGFGLTIPLRTRQYSVRRCEFDDILLRRSGANVIRHAVRTIAPDGEGYVVDAEFRAPCIVGAGGTRCPVHRHLFRATTGHERRLQVAAIELEFPFPWRDGDCRLWFFDHGLPGYAWYVPKACGWLNLGVGAMAEPLRRRRQTLHEHWQRLLIRLYRDGLLDDRPLFAEGYSYFLRERIGPWQNGNAYLAGDAAGMATRDLGEGIGPAIRSGMAVAESILRGTPAQLAHISPLSVDELVGGPALGICRGLLHVAGMLPRLSPAA